MTSAPEKWTRYVRSSFGPADEEAIRTVIGRLVDLEAAGTPSNVWHEVHRLCVERGIVSRPCPCERCEREGGAR